MRKKTARVMSTVDSRRRLFAVIMPCHSRQAMRSS